MENTAWPLAPGEDNMVPKVVKTSADAAEWGKEVYGLEGEVRGNMRGGSVVPRSKGVGIRSDDLWD
jgi:hypothetical protein